MYYRICKYGIVALLAVLTAACANRGIGPQGGPRDSLAPVVKEERPANGTLGFKGERVEVIFDEYIQLQKLQDNVLMSPPQTTPPDIRAVGKKMLIIFNEPLRDSTTYTIDFGRSITDNNERIVYDNYTYAFSTGDHLDSLAVFGQVVNAEDLNPISGLTVGIHEDLGDSAILRQTFTRIGRTDTLGEFSVLNMRSGTYRIYALQDISRDNIYQPGEGLAFQEEHVIPTMREVMTADTVYRDTIIGDSSLHLIDTIRQIRHRYMEPSDLVLWFFREDKQRHYFLRAQRKEKHCFQLYFSAPQDSMPSLRALTLKDAGLSEREDSAFVDWSQHMLIDASRGKDTLTVWLTDSAAMQDSLAMALTYWATDSLYNLYQRTDTVRAVYTAPRVNARTLEKIARKQREAFLDVKSNLKTPFPVNDTIRLNLGMPVASFITDSVHLFHRQDTLQIPIPCRVEKMDSTGLHYRVIASLVQNEQYQLTIDSAVITDLYGHHNNRFSSKFRLRSIEDYATLRIFMRPFDNRMRLQLLNEKDKVLRDLPADERGTLFDYLEAKPSYLRMYMDLNGDGRWTTGDYMKKRQPEPVYYFPARLMLRANWDFEETFDYTAVPQLESKPEEITKDGKKALTTK